MEANVLEYRRMLSEISTNSHIKICIKNCPFFPFFMQKKPQRFKENVEIFNNNNNVVILFACIVNCMLFDSFIADID